ncbi:MAG: Fe-S cluster assembly ATPase SufC [Gammaproteobacteria bacterium]|jgi:Fe-S cluster assembly ATP-binding protein|nr:Fe-S cluster assembly ATPase SufC [Gammaproteobacteria bacterium]MBT3694706.1 Fe-S cluster assembly ATPase SufC [Gammaproteobacteria bacterium]MBT5334162.1 Fe-S cluster assembly ATPase SufC [Gammaproteobacteria bacterium]MBT5681299.1 Fe-S cluster assembly ATPase SufC [Gammaproteobacteria bacterium]MBT6024757.1 Fe-S cluster assembly ATPase SufC [Gammaproteobacteria bacterium]
MSLLEVTNLHATVGAQDQQKAILKGLNISVNPGEVHAIMGPNGSGKSTLANVLSGKPGYTVTDGTLTLTDTDLTELEPHERAQLGLFLAFQYPVEIPGVSNMEFLKASVDSLARARGEEQPNTAAFIKQVRLLATSVDLDPQFLKRGVNEGFSGGEKKRNEIMQLLLLEPKLAILDETDSGLDIDALQVVAEGVNRYKNEHNGVVLITHYQRLLDYIVPDFVHVLADGKIIQSGDKSLALELEDKGYAWLT